MSQITAREPLTVTELETLALLLDLGSEKMMTARLPGGGYAWGPRSRDYQDTMDDMFAAFYALRPYEGPGSDITITRES
jgi:hypothetical protein